MDGRNSDHCNNLVNCDNYSPRVLQLNLRGGVQPSVTTGSQVMCRGAFLTLMVLIVPGRIINGERIAFPKEDVAWE